ncbi:acetate--CoA ligase family protein [Steroidobacter agaridevorans]|uniref:acetate--CoA ligase family protein n=1 Tax=Steroidobacter agaridevorans TaxID=2695856 RepID=UPI001321EDB6|nr:acetate--CoA ligase family protein [Steroidobacter agaridevorans]GFE90590.1 acyl-CoA synthetase [Steroidobacter agaridevorans]
MSHPLAALFSPRSIAFVGATERSVWTRAAFANLRTLGYDGKIFLVNRKGGEVLGHPAVSTIREIGEPVDVALLMVPSETLLDTLPELSAAGIRNAIILSAGFAESGAAGRELQERLMALAREHGISLLGPNCLGFVNYTNKAPVWTVSLRSQRARDAKIAIVSQSGALAAQMSYFAQWQGIGLTYMVSTGNEAGVGVAQVIDYLVDDPATRSIALFLESVRDAPAFARACLRASQAGKPIVVLKVGSSEVTVRSAQAHTGSLVGDDRVFDAVCRRFGLVRVTSLEDLILTAEVLARWGKLPEGGLGLISLSGGLCEIAADRAADAGVSLPSLSSATSARLAAALPNFGTPHNPLDVTGGALLDPSLLEKSLDAVAAEPEFAAVLAVLDVASAAADDSKLLRQLLAGVAAAQARADRATLLISHTVRPFTELSEEIIEATGCNYLPCGLEHGIRAVARAIEWSKLAREVRSSANNKCALPGLDSRPESERQVLEYLQARRVPVVPAKVVNSAQEAVHHASALGSPVALKIVSPDIPHKTEVGGVKLDITGDANVAAAYEQILASARRAVPDARIEGVSVGPMREAGVELFVGTMRDPQWGPVITVGLGGVWVEALRDTSLRLLPISQADALAMLDELRGKALLDGFRGTPAVDRRAAAAVIAAVGDAALALGPQLVSLEINPLRASGERIEALDGWAEWSAPSA